MRRVNSINKCDLRRGNFSRYFFGSHRVVSRKVRKSMIRLVLSTQYYEMAFLQIPHSALPEKNSKDPPCAGSLMVFRESYHI
ncbi:hypothetical protein LSTR_LSTR011660 [Laodelphax striatellus]|uniref:Uncharacterized protein n=1 Tax=Laodelphax striatellus TaxID=195883 RepID=A0A482WLA0_LAOST|nr:hypothetical protein LSTR_LSTR011660 [Laodelphax striatellus]